MDRPPEIPSLQKYVDDGGRPENYAGDLKKLQEQHEAYAMALAQEKAKRTVRVRVTPKGWPGKQTHYRVPAKAPYDPRLRPGDEGFEAKYAHEPALNLPIGRVSEVPIRDERHLAVLKADVNLEIVDDATPTHQEETVVVNEALERVRHGKGALPQAQPTAASPDGPLVIFQLEEPAARALVAKTTDLSVLADWHAEASKRAAAGFVPTHAKALATAIVDRLIDLHGKLSDLLDELAPPPPKPPEEKPKPVADPATALAGAPPSNSPPAPAGQPQLAIVPPPPPAAAQAELLQAPGAPAPQAPPPPKPPEEHKGGKGGKGKS